MLACGYMDVQRQFVSRAANANQGDLIHAHFHASEANLSPIAFRILVIWWVRHELLGRRRCFMKAGAWQVGETFEPVKAKGQKQSVYAVALDEAGALLATGSPAALVRINDTRSGDKVMKLRGHTDNVRRAQRRPCLT